VSDRQLAARLRRHVERLAGEIGERNVFRPAALAAAADYVEASFREQGYEVAAQTYDAYGVACRNLEVTRRGAERPDDLVLLGAHYDSVRGSPGANDNATGVAALLELAALFAAARPASSLRCVAFVNEEPPFFPGRDMGSSVYAQAARRRGDRIQVMASLETIGYYTDRPGSQKYPSPFSLFYPPQGDFIGFVANFRSRRWLRRAVTAFRRHTDVPLQSLATFAGVPGVGWSDHLSFWKEGYPALMITDTALYRYPHYHTPEDTPDKVDYATLARVVDGLHGMFLDLAEASSLSRTSGRGPG
jgi:Zn-dependent M28 family amino/carboxypeptidase